MSQFQPARGTRDFLPEEMSRRGYIIDSVRKAFESFGFEPMETPAFESWELLSKKGSGGDEIRDEIYYFRDKSDRELGLRFDLTVPLARVVANNPQMKMPFKRYQIGRVWRYDRPQAGRMREFMQMDVDTVGTERMDADAECIAVAFEALKQLGFSKFEIRLNSRKVLNGMIEFAGIPAKKSKATFRILDKLEKISLGDIKRELKKAGLQSGTVTKLMHMIGVKGKPAATLSRISRQLKGIAIAEEGLRELGEISALAKSYGFGKNLVIDFSLVRGLDYYTGPIFEISVTAGKNVGSVVGGGRYDNLIGLYGGRQTPATGISLGIERIYEIMKSENMFKDIESRCLIFVIAVNDAVRKQVCDIARRLRKECLRVEADVMGRDMRKQLEYANKKGACCAVIVGPKEVKSRKYTLRDMKSGRESKLSLDSIIKKIC
ncbi:MAG: histidine--tRNA ligase [Candidatus Aenigmatarchaeota archaeon]|nr:MAG: histidine--tRNA ligase [Candidatus Aenigmarchaeota archaeon]